MHLGAAIDGDDHIVHFLVEEIGHLVIEQHRVGGGGELEHLAMLLFQLAAIGHHFLDDREVHQRFAAKEVHFQILAVAAVSHQPVQRLAAGLRTQHGAAGHMVFAGIGKAILTAQVAVVRHQQAHGLHHAGIHRLHMAVVVIGVQVAHLHQLTEFGHGFFYLGGVIFASQKGGHIRCRILHKGCQSIVGNGIQRQHRAAAHIQRHALAQRFKQMDHEYSPSYAKKHRMAARRMRSLFMNGTYLPKAWFTLPSRPAMIWFSLLAQL